MKEEKQPEKDDSVDDSVLGFKSQRPRIFAYFMK